MTQQTHKQTFLEFLPVSFFGIVMSLSGLSFSWSWARKLWDFPEWPMEMAAVLAVILFVLITIAYLAKWLKYPSLVKGEFADPVSVNFFGTFVISLLLIPGLVLPYSPVAATAIWSAGAILIFLFALIVLRKWLDHQQHPGNALPAWIIPVVGTLDAPIVGYQLPVTGIHEICLVFFAIGLVFGFILMTLILSRLIFQPPLPRLLQPILLILVSPFALAYSGYDSLTGHKDMAATVLYYFDLFLLLLLLSKISLLPRCCPFRVSWWSVGFPLVAITVASFRYTSHKSSFIDRVVPGFLLVFSTLVILYLLWQTLYRFFARQLL